MRVPVRGLVVRAVMVVALGAGLGLTGVLDLTHALLVGCLLLAVVLLQARPPEPEDEGWPERTFGTRAGGRDDVSDLSWQVFEGDRTVSARVVRRVRDLANARLTLRGVDGPEPARSAEAERLLGPEVVAGLASGNRPTPRTLQTWLDAIDALTEERNTR